MRRIGPSEFEVELGEEVELTICALNRSPQLLVYLDGDPVEPIGIAANTTSYRFDVAKPVGESHQLVVRLPEPGFENAAYKLELFGAGRSVTKQNIGPAQRQGLVNLIYTFSTHRPGSGANE